MNDTGAAEERTEVEIPYLHLNTFNIESPGIFFILFFVCLSPPKIVSSFCIFNCPIVALGCDRFGSLS